MIVFWTIYLAVLLFLTYDLITSSASKITRKLLDTDILHSAIVCIMWAIWYMYFLH